MSTRLAGRFVVLVAIATSVLLCAQHRQGPGITNSTGTTTNHVAGNASAAPVQHRSGGNNGVAQVTLPPGWGLAQGPYSTVNHPGGATPTSQPNFSGVTLPGLQPLPTIVQP